MSTGQIYGDSKTRVVKIDTNLDSKEYYAVNLEASDNTPPVVNIAADASAFPFPLAEGADGSSTATEGTIIYSGRAKVKLGGTVNPGSKLTANASGEWIATTTDTDHYGATALQYGVDGDIVEVIVERGMVAG